MATKEAPGGRWVQGDSTGGILFFPPLSVQRQAWALSVLRKESVHSVLDVGCGEGDLLRALISPAPIIDEPAILPSDPSADEVNADTFLHTQAVAGLDIDRASLERFASFYLPGAAQTEPVASAPRRWTELAVSLWQGDLTAFNEEFCSFQAIVALEVLEHLDQPVLDKFAPMILGEYRPQYLLVSTPNYSFNQRFDRQGERRGFLDPTGRTERVFRNDDHKLEWTPSEFKKWAEEAANEFGYTVETSLIGSPLGDEPAPSPDSTAASQVAVFTRSTPKPDRSPRSLVPSSLPFFHPAGNHLPKHELVQRVTLPAQEFAGKPASDEEIREEVRRWMECWQRGELGVVEMWPEVCEMAGGSRRALIQALGGYGNVEPPSSSTDEPASHVSPNTPAEFTVYLPPASPGTTSPPFSFNRLHVRWRDFAAEVTGAGADGADSVRSEDEQRGYGDEGDGWGPIPETLKEAGAAGDGW